MKILIFGAKGYIGKRMLEAWPDAVGSDIRLENREAVIAELEKHKPDVVVNAVGKKGVPNVDWCETHQVETFQGNSIAPLILADACQAKNVYLLHLGTGCIFYGPSPDPRGWREDDDANPVAFYTRSKYAADLVLSRLPNVAIARLRMPIDDRPSPHGLIDKLARYKQVIDVENSVTVLEDLITACRGILEKRGTGIFHTVNPGTMRHRNLLGLYKELVDPSHQCEWITEEDLVKRGLATKKRSNCIMQSDRLRELGVIMRPIDVALRDTMEKYAKAVRASQPATATAPSSFVFQPSKPKEMKGVITAGGSGTRLAPLTHITNKHLLPIFNKPMVLYPLQTLLDSGVKNIMLTTGPEHAHAFVKLLGSGSKYGCNITYRIQDQAGGIAQAVGLAKDFVGNDNCLVHLGDNVFEDNFRNEVQSFTQGAMTFYKEVANPKQYGVVEVDGQGRVLSIEEKPEHPKSSFAQLGLYMYDTRVFDIIEHLKPSGRGELEISEVNSEYLRLGALVAHKVRGRWFDTGTFQDLKRATEYFAEREGVY